MDADDWDARYRSTDLVWSAGPNVFVERVCGPLPVGRAIDLAAGEGRNAIWLAELGWDVTAIDYSEVAIDKTRQLAERRRVTVDARVADLAVFEPPLGAYDLVLVAYLQLVDAELTPILGQAAAAVAPGGTFVLVAHDLDNLDNGYGGPQHRSVLTTPAQVAAAIGDVLDVDSAEVVDRPVETGDGPRNARDTLVVARRAG
jgi:SAM-dependent methyltransferase